MTTEERRGSARRGTQLVDTRKLNGLLESDRALRACLDDGWFEDDPSRAALEQYDRERRSLAWRAALGIGLIAVVTHAAVALFLQ